VPRFLNVLLVLLTLAVASAPGVSLAHTGHEAVTGRAAEASAIQAPSDSGGSPDHHLPVGQCCLTAAACGGGSILVSAPLVPVPERQAPIGVAALVRALHSVDLPVADRPPRTI